MFESDSSNNINFDFLYKPLHMAIFCFSPPEIFELFSEISLSKPLSKLSIKVFKFVPFRISSSSSLLKSESSLK